MSIVRSIARSQQSLWILRRPAQAWAVLQHVTNTLKNVPRWMVRSHERTNFTYDYTDLGLAAAIEFISILTALPASGIARFASELIEDHELKQWLSRRVAESPYRQIADVDIRFGRRLLYYVIVRAIKPRLVVEAGTDKGLGACVIAAALQRNQSEGAPGRLYALDVREDRGYLLGSRFLDVAELRYVDSVKFLDTLDASIDFFIHDTTPQVEHERLQFAAVERRLGPGAIAMSSWYTEAFVEFVHRTGRQFLVFPELPRDHWVPGSKLPFAFTLPWKP
jgi:predicted O-methyltransferase YrrM